MLFELKYKISVKLNAVSVLLCYVKSKIKVKGIIVGYNRNIIQIQSHKDNRETLIELLFRFWFGRIEIFVENITNNYIKGIIF